MSDDGLTLPDRSADYVDANGVVDVKRLIAAYPHEEHVARADRYFSSILDPWSHLLRKPFSMLHEAPPMLAGYAAILQMVEPMPDHVVVDFGCGAGWLSQALALMGCRPVGLDISQAVLQIARDAVAAHPYLSQRPITFKQITPDGLPLEDASVDRLICFDSFHHVADQAFYLSEFYRVLKPGGVAGFHEPGPEHSRSPDSQYEMRQHAVIENDIVIEDIEAVAKGLGFEPMRLALYLDKPVMLSAKEFGRAFDEAPADVLLDLGRAVLARGLPRRVFSLRKPGQEIIDSRFLDAFDGRIVARRSSAEAGSALHLSLTNTGSGTWRPSGGESGSVNIGVKVFAPDGRPIHAEPVRYLVVTHPVAPGETFDVSIWVEHEAPDARIEVDLVSEMVAWLSLARGGSTTV